MLIFKHAIKCYLQGNSYSKILSRNDNNKKIQCRATNPYFDEIKAVLNGSSDGYSDVKVFNVTCKC